MRLYVVVAIGLSVSACSILLGLKEITIDETVGTDAAADASVDAPIEVADATPPVCTKLIAGLEDPFGIGVDNDWLYYGDGEYGYHATKALGQSDDVIFYNPGFKILALMGDYILGSGASLISCHKPGCNDRIDGGYPLFMYKGYISGDIASYTDRLFVTDLADNGIYRLTPPDTTIAGNLLGTFVSTKYPYDVRLALTPTYVFWSEPDHDTVKRTKHYGGTVTTVFTEKGMSPMFIDGDDIFIGTFRWSDDSVLFKGNVEGGSLTPIATGLMPIRDIVGDASYLYFITESHDKTADGKLWRLCRAGCTTPELICGGLPFPNRIALDTDALFISTSGVEQSQSSGAIYKAPR